MSQLPVMFGSSLIEALIAIGALAGCSPTSKQRTDVREWFAEHGVPVEEGAIRCDAFRDDYACQVAIADGGNAVVLVTEHDDARTLTLDNARWGGTVEKLVARAFVTTFAGAGMEEVTCPAIVVARPDTTCAGRFEGSAVTVRFASRFTAEVATVDQLHVTGLVTADRLEAAARELARSTKVGELTFQCDRRVYRFGRQVRCAALSPELGDGPSIVAEFLIAADGKLSSRIVKLSGGAPWTPIP